MYHKNSTEKSIFFFLDNSNWTNIILNKSMVALVAQLVKNLPAMQETCVQFLGQEDTLEKEMASHSSILAWRIPWTEKPGRLRSMGSQESRHDLATKQWPLTVAVYKPGRGPSLRTYSIGTLIL